MSEQLVAGSHRIQQLEAEVKLVRKDDQCRTQTHEEALKILEEKVDCFDRPSENIVCMFTAFCKCKFGGISLTILMKVEAAKLQL